MRSTTSMTASAAVGGLVLLCLPALALGQARDALRIQPVGYLASLLSPGEIVGSVQDEKGAPVPGVTVSATGTTTVAATTDRNGRFELRTLSPGPYLVRAHLVGFIAPRGQIVDVRPAAKATSSIALRRSASASTAGPMPVLAAGVGGVPEAAQPAPVADSGSAGNDDHSEMAWRLRHARRSVLKDATFTDNLLGEPGADGFGQPGVFERTGPSSGLATSLFAAAPFSGQVNLLTTGAFDGPEQFFTTNSFSRSIAYLSLGAPVGDHADWTARAALTQGAIASWIVAGEYTTRAPARHRYDVGLSYSTQRYDGGDFSDRQNGVVDGSRNAGEVYAFDAYSITPEVTLTYGGRYARYDYLASESLLSPRLEVTVEPVEHFRLRGMLSRHSVAPGAEEFMPRMDDGVWLPPQRTFSSLVLGRPLEAERASHMEVGVERDIAMATVTLRAFRQHVDGQLLTLFGIDLPGAAAGHYFLSNAGDADASGVSAGLRAGFAHRLHGTVEYSLTNGRLGSSEDRSTIMLLAPSAVRVDPDRIHDLAASIETEVPETSTRVVVLYRVSNGFARPAPAGTAGAAERPVLDSRFDVQVRQSLPFMDFSSAKWEMLLAVRNFFREAAPDQSVYDELLAVRPPTRIVGGLTLKF